MTDDQLAAFLPPADPRELTIEELERVSKRTRGEILAMVRRGELRPRRVTSRIYLFDPADARRIAPRSTDHQAG